MDDKIEKKSIGDRNAEVETRSFDNGAVEQFPSSFEFSPLAEKRLVRKIDRTLVMPCIIF
jgi:hypothetical protein